MAVEGAAKQLVMELFFPSKMPLYQNCGREKGNSNVKNNNNPLHRDLKTWFHGTALPRAEAET